MKKRKHIGRTFDPKLSWLPSEHGEDWLQWQQYATEWIASQDRGLSDKLAALWHFLSNYLVEHASYAADVTAFFKGRAGHKVSSEEFVEVMRAGGLNGQVAQAKYVPESVKPAPTLPLSPPASIF